MPTTWFRTSKNAYYLQIDRVISLTPAMQELTKRRLAGNPDGPFFRTWRRRSGARGPRAPDGVR